MEVRRDRTAIARSDLSRPVQLLIGNGVLAPERTFFDFGCGLGDDVRFLKSLGYAANGWDPAHRPDETLRQAAVVNLGYVLNVIERPAERTRALRRAFDLSETCLCVSVLIGSGSYAGEVQTYGDGVLTSRNTFQRYYQQEEVAKYLQEALGIVPIPLEAGVFLIFRRSEDAHAFLLNRLQRSVPLLHGVPRQRKRLLRAALLEAFQTGAQGGLGGICRIRHRSRPSPSQCRVIRAAGGRGAWLGANRPLGGSRERASRVPTQRAAPPPHQPVHRVHGDMPLSGRAEAGRVVGHGSLRYPIPFP